MIATPKAPQRIKFKKENQTEFYSVLKKRVDAYFTSNNISKNANTAMVIKSIFIFASFIGTYLLIMSNTFSPLMMLLFAALNGFFSAMMGINIGHDAIHGSYTNNAKINKFLGLGFNLVGANDYMWNIMHNIVHHTWANIPNYDEDIDQVPIIRTNPKQALWKIHKYQHIYVFFLYALSSISWVFKKDYVKYNQDNIGGYDNSRKNKKELYRMIAYKVVYYFMFIALPIMVLNIAWYYVLLGFVVMHFSMGLTLALIFQLSHINEDLAFPEASEEGSMEYTWAAHQLFTSTNYAPTSPLASFLTGGLHLQVEHHLFPKMCHIHYRAIHPIVKETALEFGLPYYEHPTFLGALVSHIKTLKNFGKSKNYAGDGKYTVAA